MSANFVPPTSSRLLVTRAGKSITAKIPKPVVLVDSREQLPFSFSRFPNWIGGEKRVGLPVADYSIEGMEDILALERKSLTDLIGSLTANRPRFLAMCEKLSEYRHKALLVEATYEDIKATYSGEWSDAHPNGISGSLDAIESRYGIHIIYTSRHRALAEERAASYLSKHFTYWYLEQSGLGRVLKEGDL